MAIERKTLISARMPGALLSRIDFVVRNTDSEVVTNRSTALREATEEWLIAQEKKLEELGVIPKKAR